MKNAMVNGWVNKGDSKMNMNIFERINEYAKKGITLSYDVIYDMKPEMDSKGIVTCVDVPIYRILIECAIDYTLMEFEDVFWFEAEDLEQGLKQGISYIESEILL